jgi:sialidase-1
MVDARQTFRRLGRFALLATALASTIALAPAATFRTDEFLRSGEGGYFCFRIPAMVVTVKGTVLAFAEARKTNCEDWDEIDLVIRRSDDGGKNWSPLRVLFRGLFNDAPHSMNQPGPVVDRETGVVWLVFCRDNQSVLVAHSDDDGITWSAPRDVSASTKDADWKYVAAGPGHGIQLRNGRLLLAAWGDASPGKVTWPPTWGGIEFTFTLFSDDHGTTWKRGRPMYENATEEAMVTELADQRVFMTLRSMHGRQMRGHALSDDHGYSWSRIEFDPSLPEPPAHGSILNLTGNRLLFVNPASATARVMLTARISEDDGKTWPISKVVYPGSSAYSDLAVTHDGAILCLFEADRYSRLMLARFNLDWLLKGESQ